MYIGDMEHTYLDDKRTGVGYEQICRHWIHVLFIYISVLNATVDIGHSMLQLGNEHICRYWTHI